jgi:hypothetical protein
MLGENRQDLFLSTRLRMFRFQLAWGLRKKVDNGGYLQPNHVECASKNWFSFFKVLLQEIR